MNLKFPPRPLHPLVVWYRWKHLPPSEIDKYGSIIVAVVKVMLYMIAICGWLFIPLWACFFIGAFGLGLDWTNDGRWFPWSPVASVYCEKCGGGGFSGRGTGYDDVCDDCGGYGRQLY